MFIQNMRKLFKKPFTYRRGKLSLYYGIDEGIDIHVVTVRDQSTIVVRNQEDNKLESIDDLQTRTCLLHHVGQANISVAKNIVWHH